MEVKTFIMKDPIIYKNTIRARFNDLDPYGHVNSSVYLDYIISSRWNYLENELGMSMTEAIRKGVGFYLINSNMNYKRPINGMEEIEIKSWVSNLEDTVLTVDYTINNQKGKIISDGVLKFSIIDLITLRPQTLPDFVKPLFWKE